MRSSCRLWRALRVERTEARTHESLPPEAPMAMRSPGWKREEDVMVL